MYTITITYGAYDAKRRGPNAHSAIKSALAALGLLEIPADEFAVISRVTLGMHHAKRGMKHWTRIRITDDTSLPANVVVTMDRI